MHIDRSRAAHRSERCAALFLQSGCPTRPAAFVAQSRWCNCTVATMQLHHRDCANNYACRVWFCICPSRTTSNYWCPVNKRRRRDRPQTGVLTPGTGTSTKLSPERATEYITCLISNCLYLCRPFGTFHVVAQLPGVTPPSVVSRPFGTLE